MANVQDVAFKTSALVTGQQTFTTGITATGATETFIVAIVDMSSNSASFPPSVAASGVTDSASNVYLKADAVNPAGVKVAAEIWYCANATTGVTSLLVTPTTITGNTNLGVRFLTFSGMATSNAVDVTAHNNGASTAPTSTAVTTLNANDVVVGTLNIGASAPTITALPGWTHNDASNSSLATSANLTEQSGYDIVSSTGAYTYSCTLGASATWTSVIVSFKAAGGVTVNSNFFEFM
jgi:hypothetical protein